MSQTKNPWRDGKKSVTVTVSGVIRCLMIIIKSLFLLFIDTVIHIVNALDCVQALRICMNDQICSLAWEARRSSCGTVTHQDQVCSSRNLHMCQTTLVVLRSSIHSAFIPRCDCQRSTNYGLKKRCALIHGNIFGHPCSTSGDVEINDHKTSPDDYFSRHSSFAQTNHRRHKSHHKNQRSKLDRGNHWRRPASPTDVKNNESLDLWLDDFLIDRHELTNTDETLDDDQQFDDTKFLVNLDDHEQFVASWRKDHGGQPTPNGRKMNSHTSCSTLYKKCQRHVACRNLWSLYRDKCRVENYVCEMPSKKDCKEAYEGMQWTGMNSCHCDDDHSLHGPECHWIELLTSHNKCIEELKAEGFLSMVNNFTNNGNHVPLPSVYAPKDYDDALDRNIVTARVVPKPSTNTTTRTLTKFVTSTPSVTTTFLSAQLPLKHGAELVDPSAAGFNVTHQAPLSIQFTRQTFETVVASEKSLFTLTSMTKMGAGVGGSSRTSPAATTSRSTTRRKIVPFTRPKTSTTMTPSTQRRTTLIGAVLMPTKMNFSRFVSFNEVRFGNNHFRIGSTCQRAYSQCRWQQTCGWHLSEIEISCASNSKGSCDRVSCSQALRRFSAYVDRDLQEAMTFCTCKRYDVECMKVQKILFPTCMYSSGDGVLKSCHELVKACKESSICRPWHERYFSHCGWDLNNMRCSKTTEACRYAVINIRGTPLEADCYCPRQDAACSNLQSAIYFRNPCFEEARLTMIAKFTTKKPTTPSATTTTTSTTTTTTTGAKTTPTTNNTSLAATIIAIVPPHDAYRTVPRRTRPLTHLITITQAPVVRTVPHSTVLPTSTTSDRFPMPFPTTARTTKSTTVETTSTTTTSKTSTRTTTSTTTTTTTTTTATSTTTATTTAPPIRCIMFDVTSQERSYYPEQMFRDYTSVDYRCSKYCTCYEDSTITCTDLKCLEGLRCNVNDELLTSGTIDLHAFGTSMYLLDRGLCTCVDGFYVCQYPEGYKLEKSTEFFENNGLFVGIGYSELEYMWLVPQLREITTSKKFYDVDKSQWSILRDLQAEFSKIDGSETCRLIFVSRYSNYAIYQAEVRVISNSSEEQFAKGGPETMCRKPLSNLVTLINNKQMRDNSILSVIKHANLQDNLPFTSSAISTTIKSINIGSIARLLLMVILYAIFSSIR